MPHFCSSGGCTNSSDRRKDLSFHSLPILDNQQKLLSVWMTKMRRHPKHFHPSQHSKICSEHFLSEDFINPLSNKRRLKSDAVPSIFAWTKKENMSRPQRRRASEKLNSSRQELEEATDTASEGEGDIMLETTNISRKTQTFEDEFCCYDNSLKRIPCCHRFSASHLLSKCATAKKEEKLFRQYTCFNNYEDFKNSLLFLLPGLNRKQLIYWGTNAAKSRLIDTEKLFEEERDIFENELEESDDECETYETKKCLTRSVHKLSIEDEYLMTLMKLRMGLTNLDLSERFNVSESTVVSVLITWINYLYIVLGCLKVWPHRDIIFKNSPKEFIEEYPNNIIIIDATELKIQVPSALQKHSESYSNYKSHTTFKSLIGVDPNGGVLFVSQLYEGSISDKEIVRRSGLLDVLEKKLQVGEIRKQDSIMADKGFDIKDDLKKLDLQLNIPPFLHDQIGFQEDDVIKTQTIAKHRIHVERAIAKIRNFKIFHSNIPVAMFGTVNQIWTVACFLSNFQNPVLAPV